MVKGCLRICSLPKWKQTLYDKINTGPHSWNKVPIDSEYKYSCVNAMEIENSIEAFGFGRLSNETSLLNRLQIQFVKKLMIELVSVDCADYEMNYKYSVMYKQITGLDVLDLEQSDSEYQIVVSK